MESNQPMNTSNVMSLEDYEAGRLQHRLGVIRILIRLCRRMTFDEVYEVAEYALSICESKS